MAKKIYTNFSKWFPSYQPNIFFFDREDGAKEIAC